MAKPPILQQLQKGKLLCDKTAPDFVATFNYSVNRLDNLKGDKDINPQNGVISVDNTDPEHPVIRCDVTKKDTKEDFLQPCELDRETGFVSHIYWRVEEILVGDGGTAPLPEGLKASLVYLKVYGYSDVYQLLQTDSVATFRTLALDLSAHYIPLYLIEDGGGETGELSIVDLRMLPTAQSWMISTTTA